MNAFQQLHEAELAIADAREQLMFRDKTGYQVAQAYQNIEGKILIQLLATNIHLDTTIQLGLWAAKLTTIAV